MCEWWGCYVQASLHWCENRYWTNSSTLKPPVVVWVGKVNDAFLSPHQREDRALIDAGINTGIGLLLLIHAKSMILRKYAQTNIVAVNIEGVAAVQHLISSPSDVSGYLTVLPKCTILS